MSWEWSHTSEAYENARHNLTRLKVKTLVEIFSEWKVWDIEQADKAKHDAWLKGGQEGPEPEDTVITSDTYAAFGKEGRAISRKMGRENLEDYVWERMSDYATCDNGGHDAHCCPYACGCHKVSFSRKKESLFKK
jgi:hypothetical protein